MSSNNYLLEVFILGTLVFWGLTCVDINVTVNVNDKQISANDEKIENINRCLGN